MTVWLRFQFFNNVKNYCYLLNFVIIGDSPSKKKLKIEEEDRDKHERSSSNVDAILEDVIKGGCEDKGTVIILLKLRLKCSSFILIVFRKKSSDHQIFWI